MYTAFCARKFICYYEDKNNDSPNNLSGENIPIRPSSSSGLSPRSSGSKVWKMECIPYDALMPPEAVRQSTCELEVDVVAADILNRFQVHGKQKWACAQK